MLRLLLFFTLWGTLSCAFGQERPNILFLFSDDQRADALGAAGNPYIQTPNLDSLAARGTHFTQNYCMGSHHGAVCAPSRAMLMSGRSLFNVYDRINGLPTLPISLRQNDYLTFGTGKWHNEREAFAAGFVQGENVFLGGMSDHYHVPVRDLQEDGTFSKVQRKDYSTSLFAQSAIDFIRNYGQSEQEQPFFAYVAFTAPHDPRSPLPAFAERYDPAGIPLPPDAMEQHPFDIGPMKIRDEVLGAWPRTQSQLRSQIADYYAMITQVDEEIGRIFQQLRAQGLNENTIVIFSSDHGLGIGSHGLLGKQNLYESGMHSPLIIAGPGLPQGKKQDALVYLYDLYPTLCDMLGISVPQGVEGKSLLPIIKDEKEGVREYLFTTYGSTQRAIRDDRWKMIVYPRIGITQFFDLQNDPYELRSLKREDAPQAFDRMYAQLKAHQTTYNDTLKLENPTPANPSFDPTGFRRKADRHQPIYNLWHYFAEPAGAGKLLIYEEEMLEIFPPETQVEMLGDTFGFTEGPVWHPEGYLLFSDIPRNTIYRWDTEAGFSQYLKPSGHSNGLAIGAQGNLIAVQHGGRQIVRLGEKEKVLADKYKGKQLNSPNDLAIHSNGNIYFTDPPWGLGNGPDKWDYHPDKELSFNGVYLLKGKKLILLDSALYRPNGIALSPDERFLYVGNNQFKERTRTLNIDRTNKSWFRYLIEEDGTLGERMEFLKPPNPYLVGNPDGMKIDSKGYFYCTGPGGLLLFNPTGKYLGTLMLPQIPTNVAFGADDYLYITARQAVYRVKLLRQ
ncbi:MAG: sulfatase-like hydrolase/transferase [Bacteroidota bacterium]